MCTMCIKNSCRAGLGSSFDFFFRDCLKDGVTLSDNLDWSKVTKHITTTTTKANSRLSFIKRNLKDCPKTLKELAYFSLST